LGGRKTEILFRISKITAMRALTLWEIFLSIVAWGCIVANVNSRDVKPRHFGA